MKPLLLSFRELQAELRSIARETKKFQPQQKVKKTFAQVHVTSENTNARAEGRKCTSELTELTEMVKKLSLSQEAQMARLSILESSIKSPSVSPNAALPTAQMTNQSSVVVCHRCGKQGHIARFCRAVLPDFNSTRTHHSQPPTSAEESSMPTSQSLNA
ncbi:hypothetical protein GOODEAATRI_031988 [Goodea atripinnis]|uniref:CCHC-type domain-containing protein n=1 Tax=Goodea atripinnis TaxID=208336 RepID=A0ABV0N878_9TELE